MTATVGDVYGTLAASVLMRPPSSETDQLLDHGDWSTVPGSLVERSVPGGSIGSGGVDPLSMSGQQLQYTGPFAALRSVGQPLARFRCFVGQRSGLGDSIPNDIHVEPDATLRTRGVGRTSSTTSFSASRWRSTQHYAAATARQGRRGRPRRHLSRRSGSTWRDAEAPGNSFHEAETATCSGRNGAGAAPRGRARRATGGTALSCARGDCPGARILYGHCHLYGLAKPCTEPVDRRVQCLQ